MPVKLQILVAPFLLPIMGAVTILVAYGIAFWLSYLLMEAGILKEDGKTGQWKPINKILDAVIKWSSDFEPRWVVWSAWYTVLFILGFFVIVA